VPKYLNKLKFIYLFIVALPHLLRHQ